MAPLEPREWLALAGLAGVILVVMESHELLRRLSAAPS